MELDQIVAHVADGAKQILQADAAMVCLLDGPSREFSVAATAGIPDDVSWDQAPAVAAGGRNQGVVSRETIILGEAPVGPWGGVTLGSHCSVISVPLIYQEELLGALRVYAAEPQCFGAGDEEKLAPVAALGAKAVALSRAYARLEEREASRARFIRIATHELRSPITVAQSLVRNVVKGYAGELTEEQSDLFGRISRRLDALEALVNDLLDLAAGKSPELAESKEPVAINSSVGRAVLLIQPRAEERDVDLTLEPCCEELVVLGTEEGLDRVFVNLVENAVKYTPPGGSVDVSLSRDGEEVQVKISDTGIGIPEEAMSRLFDEFYRAQNAKKMEGTGTGLGLAIVKDLVDQFGGRIEIESRVGEGTTVFVTFPVHPVDA